MIRIVIVTADHGAAANIGGPVESSVKTFDVEAPAVEAHLREFEYAKDQTKRLKQQLWWNRSVAGIEVLPAPPKQEEPPGQAARDASAGKQEEKTP